MGLLEPHGRGRRPFRRDALTADATVIIVHALAHAVAALSAAAQAGRPVVLASAPDAGIYGGPGWFREMIAAARERVPEARCSMLLDCGDDAGAAQGAIRAGVEAIIFTGRADVAERLADIADQRGVRVLMHGPPHPLDLATSFFASTDALRRTCIDHLTVTPAKAGVQGNHTSTPWIPARGNDDKKRLSGRGRRYEPTRQPQSRTKSSKKSSS